MEKQLERFRQKLLAQQRILTCFFVGIGAVLAFLNLGARQKLVLSEAGQGFLSGFFSAAELLLIFYTVKLRRAVQNAEACRQMYIAETDECKQSILLRSFACGDLFLMILLLAGIFVASFLNEAVCLTLIITLMAAGCCKLPFKWYFSHRM